MTSNLQLSLDLSPPDVPRPDNPDILTRFKVLEQIDFEELKKVDDDFVSRLEDEVNKINAFKRELPLSFLLLTNAIDKLKEEAPKFGERQKESKFDELAGVKLGNDEFEKKSWMSSVQLWSPRGEDGDNDDQSREWQPSKYRRGGGALSSFTDGSRLSRREQKRGFSPVAPGLETPVVEPGSDNQGSGENIPGSTFYPVHTGSIQHKLPYQTTKKRRRCWSPELHRRFVDALERLGGPQVATPKQIRELMQVDGLTNDEVKSHLQKYRLHVRKLPATSRTNPSSSSNDLAMSRDRGPELGCSMMGLLHSRSPEGPLHLRSSGKCNSTSIEDHHDYDDDDNNNNNDNSSTSDSHSWSV